MFLIIKDRFVIVNYKISFDLLFFFNNINKLYNILIFIKDLLLHMLWYSRNSEFNNKTEFSNF